MSEDATTRMALPFLAAGQAQKELSHNEALALLDIAVQPVAEAVGTNTPPATPAAGQCWIIGTAPSGAWTGRAGALAGWTTGGWRFVAPREGMTAWSIADATIARFSGGAWSIGELRGSRLTVNGDQVVGPRRPGIAAATGGSVIDAEARATLSAVLAALREHGLIA